MPRLKIHTQSTFNGYMIIDERRQKSGKKDVRSFYTNSLDKIYQLGKYSIEVMSKPEAYMYTFCFTEEHKDYSITEVINRIKDTYQTPKKGKINPLTGENKGSRLPKNTFTPLFYWCRELSNHPDHAFVGHEHYHLMLICDTNKGRIGAAKLVIDRLRKKGIIKTANISKDQSEDGVYEYKGKSLKAHARVNLKEDFARYMYWFSYLAKVETRMDGRSCDSSRIPKA